MNKRTIQLAIVLSVLAAGQLFMLPVAGANDKGKGRGNNDMLGTIYVSGQGLYYDTFKTTDLPPSTFSAVANPIKSMDFHGFC